MVAVGWVARVTAPVRQGPASAWAAGEWVGVVVGVRAAESAREAEQAPAVARGQALLALPGYGNRAGVVEQEAVEQVVVAGVLEEGREAAAVEREAAVLAAGVVLAPAALAVGVELVAVEQADRESARVVAEEPVRALAVGVVLEAVLVARAAQDLGVELAG